MRKQNIKKLVLLAIFCSFEKNIFAESSTTATVPIPIFASEFGRCVRVLGTIERRIWTQQKNSSVRSLMGPQRDEADEYILTTTITTKEGQEKKESMKIAGYSKEIDEKINSVSADTKATLYELIGYEQLFMGGAPKGVFDFPELGIGSIVASVDWYCRPKFIVLYIKTSNSK
jgi:hypothetical protein